MSRHLLKVSEFLIHISNKGSVSYSGRQSLPPKASNQKPWSFLQFLPLPSQQRSPTWSSSLSNPTSCTTDSIIKINHQNSFYSFNLPSHQLSHHIIPWTTRYSAFYFHVTFLKKDLSECYLANRQWSGVIH